MSDSPNDPFATFRKLFARLKRGGDDAPAGAGGLDFLPGDYALRRRRRRTDATMLGLSVVVLGTIGATWHLAERRLREAEAEFALVDAEYDAAARRIEQVRRMRAERKAVADRMELTASLLEKLPRSNLLAEVTNALPHGVALTEFALEAERHKPPVPTVDPAEGTAPPAPLAYDTAVTLTGVAGSEGQVSDYVSALAQSDYFAAADLRWVGLSGGRGGEAPERKFMIAVRVAPGATARREEATR